jgi:quinol-cytochrome oxidoreductase complex cytochrome b subunit
LRLTPLNIVTSVVLVWIAYLLLNQDEGGWRLLGTIPLFALVLISFVSDLLFRRFLKDIKRIWIIEVVFIIFVAVAMILIQR